MKVPFPGESSKREGRAVTRPRRYFFFLSPLSLMMRPGSSWLMVDGSRRGQDVRNGVQRTSGYLDEISFPLGSPAASRDSFSLYSRKIFASIESRSFSRFREISNYARKIRLFFFFFFFKKEEKKNDRSFFLSLSLLSSNGGPPFGGCLQEGFSEIQP